MDKYHVRLNYLAPNGVVIEAGNTRFEEGWYDIWLERMVSENPDVIFFLTVETTDLWS